MEIKSLTEWWDELSNAKGRLEWLRFYSFFIKQPVSNRVRFYRALNLYGEWPVFEAIIDSCERPLTGDKLNYVLKVAANKWREEQEHRNEQADYTIALEESKKASQQANKDLAKRIKRRKK